MYPVNNYNTVMHNVGRIQNTMSVLQTIVNTAVHILQSVINIVDVTVSYRNNKLANVSLQTKC